MSLDYEAVRPIYDQLNSRFGPLSNRGDAHITVLTPTEFSNGLNRVLSINEINKIATDMNIQSSPFEVLCVAKQSQFGSKLGKKSAVYNLLVKSDAISKIRTAIFNAYTAKGGDPSNFYPEYYLPHITLGFESHGNSW